MSSSKLKIVLPIVVLAVGVAGTVLLATARKAPPRTERASLGPLVEVLEVHREDVPVVVKGNGQVGAKVAVDVVPQVAGRVVKVDPALVTGGFFKAGTALMEIEPRDFELAVERAHASVARSQVALEQQQAEAAVARQEWEALHPGEEPTTGLVVREPQVRQAEAELAAAYADLQVARLNLERTRISVPFDGVVVTENVDVGQYVAPGQPVARVYGTRAVEVRMPLENRELAWFMVPNGDGASGPRAEVEASYAGSSHIWEGRVTRMEAEVDPGSRMVNVIVEVLHPYDRADSRPPLLPGTFVDVRVFGRTVEDVISLPRYAVREESKVWVVEDDALRIRSVEVVRSDREFAYISAGLADGDQVVVSSLDAVTDGMAVRPAESAGDGEGGTSKLSLLVTEDSRLKIPTQTNYPRLKVEAAERWVGENLQFSIFNFQFGCDGGMA